VGGQAGSGSKLHVDAKVTRFYMVVLSGTKEWRMFNASDRFLLGGDNHGRNRDGSKTLHPTVLSVDAFDPKLKESFKHDIKMWEGVAQQGDIVFVPESWPHQVRKT